MHSVGQLQNQHFTPATNLPRPGTIKHTQTSRGGGGPSSRRVAPKADERGAQAPPPPSRAGGRSSRACIIEGLFSTLCSGDGCPLKVQKLWHEDWSLRACKQSRAEQSTTVRMTRHQAMDMQG